MLKRNPKAQKGLFPKILVSDLKKLPVKTIDLLNKNEINLHDKVVELVNNMLIFKKQFFDANTPQTKTVIERQIEVTDRQIDELVYELYGLTEDEIKTVEESFSR